MDRGTIWKIALAAAACAISLVWAQPPTPPNSPAANPSPPAKTSAPEKKKRPKDPAPVPKFESRLAANARLVSRVQVLLPKGATLEAATKGFKSESLFIATLHASQNLGIPFEQLKAEVTGSAQDSLGQAIRNFRPELDLDAIQNSAKTAEQQAKADLKETRESRPKPANTIEVNFRLL